jgi:hypothetical protein
MIKDPFAIANPVPKEARAGKFKTQQPNAHNIAIDLSVIARIYYTRAAITTFRAGFLMPKRRSALGRISLQLAP